MEQRSEGPAVLCRALGTLGRGAADGTLTVRGGGGRSATIRLIAGRIASIAGADGSLLGDVLTRDGLLDARALVDEAARASGEPIGRYLVRSGRIDRGALAHALRVQLRERLRVLFAWDRVTVTFVRGPRVRTDDELPGMADSLVDALRATMPDEPLIKLARELGEERLVLSSFGRDWLPSASLRPEEAAVVAMLGQGTDGAQLAARLDRRALRFAVALRRVRAAEPARASGDYALLLRKHHELRRSKDATTLLGVSRGASRDDARRALRALARDLHPDRFDAGSDRAARAVSGEVLKALIRAESELREQVRAPTRGRAR